jgi:DNA processing protein
MSKSGSFSSFKKHLVQSLRRGEQRYPRRLLDLSDPPERLFFIGDIQVLDEPSIAIVGSREASSQGLHHAYQFASELSLAGYHVISGLARGVDSAAHRGAIKKGLPYKTIAVCGNGLDSVYTRENSLLAKQIAKNGLLLSEYPPGIEPKGFHFPRRNRIIAALSIGTIVIEAAQKSGSLITANLANALGREVFAIPGPIASKLYEGSHRLIQQGAKLVIKVEDVLEELPKHPSFL